MLDFNSLLVPLLIALIAIPFFLQARKQKRAMQEQQRLQDSLAAGDRVMTTSGLYGTVVSTADDTIDLEIAPDVTTTWVRQAIREKVDTDAARSESDVVEESGSPSETSGESAEGSSRASSEGSTQAGEESIAANSTSAQVAEPLERQKAN